MFTWEEIVKANGSTLWNVSDDGTEQICISRAILDLQKMQPIGAIHVVCEVDYFALIIREIGGNYSNRSYVVDETGKVMCSSFGDSIGLKLSADVLDNQKSIVTVNGEKSYIYRGKTMDNSWTIVTVVPTREIEKEIFSFTILTCFITIVAMGMGIFLIFLLTDKMTKPLMELSSKMKAIQKGDFTKRVVVHGDDEIGQLGYRYNHMADSIEVLIEQVYKMEISSKQAEIELLKMQINPHFLYNTLDTISWMARIEKKDEIAEVATALGDLLRATIKQESFITITEELKSVRNYVFIQEYRFEDKITVEYEVESKLGNYVIPNFILQPLVENAIIHGMEPKLDHGLLIIRIYIEDKRLHFQVIDDGIGMSQEEVEKIYEACKDKSSNHRIGIKNV
ncbi:MAG TPA: sensor histidine kinase [Candidatus Merdenecus merdavium]|nr:sensor histidine kinase [Candidatus Merdenecus merdavium]